jgi:GDPmannose 4,6-dehydratase
MNKALITGITGQDGSYLAELLLSKGYEVHGTYRRAASPNRMDRIEHIKDAIHLHSATVENYQSIYDAIIDIGPDEVYHLAAQSFVQDSFHDEFTTMKINSVGTHNVLSSILKACPWARFYFAGSSEQFGEVLETPQTEKTKFNPRSVYGISKCTGYYLTQQYRKQHDTFACCGILFNHESPRRGLEFVTRKITNSAAKIYKGLQNKLYLGNLDAVRDWGHSRDYVAAMWKMLQMDTPDDYVISTGEYHSVREFCDEAFRYFQLDYRNFVEVDERYMRPTDVVFLCGDSSKARTVLGWTPQTTFSDLVREMCQEDLKNL